MKDGPTSHEERAADLSNRVTELKARNAELVEALEELDELFSGPGVLNPNYAKFTIRNALSRNKGE